MKSNIPSPFRHIPRKLSHALGLALLTTPLLSHAATYPEIILESNPQAYWRLGDLNESDFILDETLNHPLIPQAVAGGELGAAGALEDIGDPDTALNIAFRPEFRAIEATPSSLLNANSPFTVELWIKSAMFGGTLLGHSQTLPSRGFTLAISDDGSPIFRTGGSSDATGEVWEDVSGGQLSPGRWSHLVCSWDGTYKEIYLNGLRVALQEAQVLPAATSTFSIGGDFNGTLDELAFYRRALTSAEIIRHYEAAGRTLEGFMTLTPSPQEPAITLSWKGDSWLLETTVDPLGPDSFWESLPEATSPFTFPTSDTFRFFRLVKKTQP